MREEPATRRFRWAAAASAGAVLAFMVWMIIGIGGTYATSVVDNLGELGAAFFAAGACLFVGVRTSGRARQGWVLLGASALVWGLGQGVWSWYELVESVEVPFPSWADLGFLAAVPLAGAALLLFPAAPTAASSRARAVLDGLIIAMSLLLVSWMIVLGDVYRTAEGGLVEEAISLAYPMADVVIGALAIAVLARARGSRRGPLVLIGGGLLALAIADTGFAYLTQTETYGAGNVVDTGWFAGYLLIGLAALLPVDEDEHTVAAERVSHLQLAVPYVPLAIAALVAAGKAATHSRFDSITFGLGIATVGLVVVRQLVTLVENVTLNQSLEHTVAELRDREGQLEYQAFHDSLTNLANRALFRDRVEHALARQRRLHQPVAALMIDLDDFKAINDTLGHEAGDQLLMAVAERLRACVRPGDTSARLGGDEFAVLLEDGATVVDAQKVAQRLVEAMQASFNLVGKEVFVHASIGLAMTESSIDNPDDLMRNADVALYAAKEQGKDRFELFDPAMRELVFDRLQLKSELASAVEHEQFVVHYQPVINLTSAQVTGVEALVRWQHPERGLVMPQAFIPLAEETGAIVAIGRKVLQTACEQLASWAAAVPSLVPLTVNVNLSARQLLHGGIVDDVGDALEVSGVAPQQLVLEITESVLVTNTAMALTRLRQLCDLGVRLAIDDFGSGYSSLGYLRRLPVQVLKIDKSFVDDLAVGDGVAVLVDAIIKLADTLELETVAEGVELESQCTMLTALGCTAAQGYYFAAPSDAHTIGEFLRQPRFTAASA
jgi:diguanylate cyclase (GGDEF)-like protein